MCCSSGSSKARSGENDIQDAGDLSWFGKTFTQLKVFVYKIFRIVTNKIIIARMIANVRTGQALEEEEEDIKLVKSNTNY